MLDLVAAFKQPKGTYVECEEIFKISPLNKFSYSKKNKSKHLSNNKEDFVNKDEDLSNRLEKLANMQENIGHLWDIKGGVKINTIDKHNQKALVYVHNFDNSTFRTRFLSKINDKYTELGHKLNNGGMKVVEQEENAEPTSVPVDSKQRWGRIAKTR